MRLGENLPGPLNIGSFETDDHGDFESDFGSGGDEGFGNQVAAGDAAEDVHQNPLDLRIGEDDSEGFESRLAGDAAAHVQKIGRGGAVQFDDVHGRHGQAGAVDQAADVAVQGDVVQIRLAGPQVQRLFLRFDGQRLDFLVPEQGVVVEIDFGVDGQKLVVAGDDQGIDLHQGSVGFEEDFGKIGHQFGRFAGQFVLEPQAVGQFAGLVALQSDE